MKGHTVDECRQKDLICNKCKQKGHKERRCTQSNDNTREIKHCVSTVPNGSMHKRILINSNETDALVDTGSDVTLVREDFYRKLFPLPALRTSDIKLTGIGNVSFIPLGMIDVNIVMDGTEFNTTVHIVSSNISSVPVLLGKDFLHNHTFIIKHGEITVIDNEFNENNIFAIAANICTDELPTDVQQLIDTYKPINSQQTDVQMTIVLKDDERVYHNPRRLPIAEKQIVDEQIAQWLKDDIICHSTSEYASPILLVKKKDNTSRLCVDFRRLNKKIVKDRFPFPNMEEQLDQLQSAKWFTTLDLENGFFHVPVEQNSRKFTAFCCHQGIFEFKKAPFGLCNSPSAFQRFITHVFRQLISTGIVIIYIDDIIIPSSTRSEGIDKLKCVLNVAAQNGLKIKWSKCQFVQQKVEYLGFIVENGTIQPSEQKLKAVQKFPKPTSVKHVQSFLGLTGYFRKFIHNYSKKSVPLTDLLRKDRTFCFGVAQMTAFEELKTCLITAPILHIFQPDLPTELHTDASKQGYGAVLLQQFDQSWHPVYYYSKHTTVHEQNYTSFELEILAIITCEISNLFTQQAVQIGHRLQSIHANNRKKSNAVV